MTRQDILELDPEDPDSRRRLIETFVNSIYLWDDKITMTFNYSGDTRRVTLQDLDSGSVFSPDTSPGSYSSLQGVPSDERTNTTEVIFFLRNVFGITKKLPQK